MTRGLKNFLTYLFLGFFVIFTMSLMFPQDICGGGEIYSTPRIFYGFAVVILTLFYFANRSMKKWWQFVIFTAVFSFIFEALFIKSVLRPDNYGNWGVWVGMSVYWIIWMILTRLIFKKLKR